eukprot:12826139-Heterocapsa_arctica.AAC.1
MWARRTAKKLAAGVLAANHNPVRFQDQGKEKRLRNKCGIFGIRPIDMGQDCTEPLGKGNTRYWKWRQ